MLIDLATIRGAAEKHENKHWLMANVANPANLANSKPNNPDELAKLATLAGLAISHMAESTPPDPDMAQLLALADRYCTAIQASGKARADWHSDVQATPPGDRDGLAAYLRGKLAKLASTPLAMRPKAAPPALAKPVPKFSQAAPWRAADNAFQAHYWQCPQCKTGGRTRGPLCPQGQQLSAAVDQAFAAA